MPQVLHLNHIGSVDTTLGNHLVSATVDVHTLLLYQQLQQAKIHQAQWKTCACSDGNTLQQQTTVGLARHTRIQYWTATVQVDETHNLLYRNIACKNMASKCIVAFLDQQLLPQAALGKEAFM